MRGAAPVTGAARALGALFIVAGLLAFALPAPAQVPDVRDPVAFDNDPLGEEWAKIGSNQVVRRKASARFVPSLVSRENRDVVDLLMETAYADRDYLEQWCATLRAAGFETESILAGGDPATEIASAAEREACDLIAMAVHGHKGLQDVFYGTTANGVRHKTMVPVLMVRGPAGGRPR